MFDKYFINNNLKYQSNFVLTCQKFYSRGSKSLYILYIIIILINQITRIMNLFYICTYVHFIRQ